MYNGHRLRPVKGIVADVRTGPWPKWAHASHIYYSHGQSICIATLLLYAEGTFSVWAN